jgi:hypothetical protein
LFFLKKKEERERREGGISEYSKSEQTKLNEQKRS